MKGKKRQLDTTLPENNRLEIQNLIGYLNHNIVVKITVLEQRIQQLEFELKSLKNQEENFKSETRKSLIRYLSDDEE